MRSAKEDEPCKTKPGIDLVSAVEEFHKLSYRDLSKLIRDAENDIIRHTKYNGSLLEINMESLARNLAVHVISKLLSFKQDEQHLRYLLAGLRLLHGFYDLGSHHTKLEKVLVEDANSLDRILDLTFFIVIFISNFRQKLHSPILASSLLASSLYLLKLCFSSKWHEITSILLLHPKGDAFTSAAFAAVRVLIGFLQVKLSAQHTDIMSNANEVNCVCLHSEVSLQFLHSLCQENLFREHLVKNKELCEEGGVLLLVRDIMKLPQCEEPHLKAAVLRLKSKSLSIMLQLCEMESISCLNFAASTTKGLDLAKSTVSEVLEMLRIMFCGDVNGVSSSYNPRGIMRLNAMRLTEILSHDSNFRSYIVSNFTEVLTGVLLVPHGEFLSSWCCSGSEPAEEDITLNYDSFSAAGQLLGVMSPSLCSESTFSAPRASETPFAHQKTSLLVKILANLTSVAPDVCKEERGLFLKTFFRCLQDGGGGSERAAAASRNLCSLLVHAGSLTPGFLHKDDVSLLRVFITKLEKLINTPQENNINRAKEVGNRRKCSSRGPQRSSPGGCNRRKEGGVDGREKDAKIEAIGSYLSDIPVKNASDRMNNNVEEEEMGRSVETEEKQLKKRKRNLMNDVQIAMIEKALEDEPEMQRRATLIQLWADKLSLHGSEVTCSQLKNWLNNRRAKLARAAAKVSEEDEDEVSESPPESPCDEVYEPSRPRVLQIGGNQSASVARRSSFRRESGEYVGVVDENGEEIGRGIIHLARGIWFDINLQESGVCVVDVTDLQVTETYRLPHPCDATGSSFAQAQMILGKNRVLWDSTKLLFIHTSSF